MKRTHFSAVLATLGVAVFAAVAYDATLIADALGVPARDGEAGVATAGLGLALAVVASGLRGLRLPRVRIANPWANRVTSGVRACPCA